MIGNGLATADSRHRYFRKLPLDGVLPDLHEPNKAQLEEVMKGHVIGEAHLMEVYSS